MCVYVNQNTCMVYLRKEALYHGCTYCVNMTGSTLFQSCATCWTFRTHDTPSFKTQTRDRPSFQTRLTLLDLETSLVIFCRSSAVAGWRSFTSRPVVCQHPCHSACQHHSFVWRRSGADDSGRLPTVARWSSLDLVRDCDPSPWPEGAAVSFIDDLAQRSTCCSPARSRVFSETRLRQLTSGDVGCQAR